MNILIVEDESRIAQRVARFTKEILKEEIGALVLKDKMSTAWDYLHQHPIDLLLLDLNLSGKDGFEMLKSVLAQSFATIIISANREKALEAFEYGVLDFVPKPFDQERLEKALNRFRDKQQKSDYAGKYLAIKKNGKILLLQNDDILYIQGANIYAEIYTQDGRKELSDKSLDHLYQILPPRFARIHKSYIANMSQAREIIISAGSKYQLLMEDGTLLPIGRSKYKEMKAQFFS